MCVALGQGGPSRPLLEEGWTLSARSGSLLGRWAGQAWAWVGWAGAGAGVLGGD